MKQIILLFIGIFIALSSIEVLLQTSSLVIKYVNKISNTQKIKAKITAKDNNTIRILCIGESTTYNQYTKVLPYFLDKKTNKDYVIIDCGIPGTNIKNIAQRIEEQIKYYKPDIVVTMMGINDAKFNDRLIYKKYPIKIANLFVLIKRNIENIVSTKLYANSDVGTNYKKIVDEYFNTKKGLEPLINIVTNNPKDIEAFQWLIFAYKLNEQYLEVEKYSKKFLDIYPMDITILYTLTENNIKQDKIKEAYEIISSVISSNEINSDYKNKYFEKVIEPFMNYLTLDQIKEYYELLVLNKVETSILDNLYKYLKTNNIEVKYYTYKNKYKNVIRQPNFNTQEIKHGYLYIANQIISNDIVYLCMGYPTIPIENFKRFFEGTVLIDKICFVSNENNFMEELKKYTYYQIFMDNFAGTFGHCTNYGNELIAKNLAQVIIKLIK